MLELEPWSPSAPITPEELAKRRREYGMLHDSTVKKEGYRPWKDYAMDGEEDPAARRAMPESGAGVEGALEVKEPLMPVKSYYSQKEPAADAVIWRFMDLRKFRDLMASEELYFRRADLFDDETEGLPPEQYVHRVLRLDPLDLNDRMELNNHLGSLAQSREMHYITCWYLFDQETLKMWEGYGHDGVAIVSRYDLLKAALDKLIDETHIGLVQYGTAHLTDRFNALEFITTKQAKYEHECEVRAMLTCTDPLAGGNRHIDLNNVPHPRPLPVNPRHAWVPDCKRRRIVLKDLVQEVIISPWAEADNVEEMNLWNSHKGFKAPMDSAAPGLQDAKAGRIPEAHGDQKAATRAGASSHGTRASALL